MDAYRILQEIMGVWAVAVRAASDIRRLLQGSDSPWVGVDPLLERLIAQDGSEADLAKELRGQVAVASAKLAYQVYTEIFSSDRYGTFCLRPSRLRSSSMDCGRRREMVVEEPCVARDSPSLSSLSDFGIFFMQFDLSRNRRRGLMTGVMQHLNCLFKIVVQKNRLLTRHLP